MGFEGWLDDLDLELVVPFSKGRIVVEGWDCSGDQCNPTVDRFAFHTSASSTLILRQQLTGNWAIIDWN